LDDVVRFHPDGRLLLMRCETQDMQEGPFSHARPTEHPRVCRLRDLLSPEPVRPLAEITEFNRYVYPIVAPVDGRFFIVEGIHDGPDGNRRTVRTFDGLDGREVWSVANPVEAPHSRLAVDPTGTILQIGHGNYRARLVKVATGEFIAEVRECRALAPGARYGEELNSIFRLHEGSDPSLLDVPGGDTASCVQSQFSPDGRLYACGNRTGEVFLCEIQAVLDRLAKVGLTK
jgi:hypothetical protein